VLELEERIIVVLKVVVLGRNGEKLFCLSSKKASKSKKAKKTNYDAACGSPKFMSHRTAILTCPAPYIPPAAPARVVRGGSCVVRAMLPTVARAGTPGVLFPQYASASVYLTLVYQ